MSITATLLLIVAPAFAGGDPAATGRWVPKAPEGRLGPDPAAWGPLRLRLPPVLTARRMPTLPPDDDAPPRAGEPDAAPSAAAQALAEAKEIYFLGDHDTARSMIRGLLAQATDEPGTVPFEVEAEALVYLGELQYFAGDQASAEATFRLLLVRDPDWTISRYEHPMEVIGLFETVRSLVEAERDLAPRGTRPLPWWGYAPLGLPQYLQDRPVRGAVYTVLQVGLTAASVGAWAWIDRVQIDPGTEESPDALSRAQQAARLRDTLSIPTATGAWLSWGASVLDGGLSWRRDQALQVSGVGLAPSADGGAQVAITGRF